jgi:hypothetical protein
MSSSASKTIRPATLFLQSPAVRVGLVIGFSASLVLVVWVFLANRMPSLEAFAMERNVAAEAVLGLLVLIPAVYFFRTPIHLLLSGLIVWTVFSFCYWLLSLYFTALGERWSTAQVLTKGYLGYLIAMVTAWVLSVLMRVRTSRATRLRPSSLMPEAPVSHHDSVVRS